MSSGSGAAIQERVGKTPIHQNVGGLWILPAEFAAEQWNLHRAEISWRDKAAIDNHLAPRIVLAFEKLEFGLVFPGPAGQGCRSGCGLDARRRAQGIDDAVDPLRQSFHVRGLSPG